jgi:hypothetical protein
MTSRRPPPMKDFPGSQRELSPRHTTVSISHLFLPFLDRSHSPIARSLHTYMYMPSAPHYIHHLVSRINLALQPLCVPYTHSFFCMSRINDGSLSLPHAHSVFFFSLCLPACHTTPVRRPQVAQRPASSFLYASRKPFAVSQTEVGVVRPEHATFMARAPRTISVRSAYVHTCQGSCKIGHSITPIGRCSGKHSTARAQAFATFW